MIPLFSRWHSRRNRLRDETMRAADAETRKKQEETQRTLDVQKALFQFKTAMAAADLDAAAQAWKTASLLAPSNPDVLQALQDLQKAQEAKLGEAQARKKRQEEYEAFVKRANEALAAKRDDEGIRALDAARILNPQDVQVQAALLQAQKDRDEALRAAERESRKRQEDLQRTIEIQKALAQYQSEMAARNLDAADRILKQAALLAPTDPLVMQAQQDLQKARLAAETESRRNADLQKALGDFRTTLATRDIDGATRAYSMAVSLAPNDPAVLQARLDLQKASDAALTDAAARDKRTRDFQARLADGNNAMLARRYDDAIIAFTAAQVLNPNDPTVPGLLQQAQTARANLQAALTQFRTALAARDLNGANTAYNAAVSLAPPNDPTVAQAGLDLQKAQGVAGSRDQRTRDFQARLADGNNAMLARRYDDAITAFTAAQVLNPNDPTVPGLLQQAQTARANLQAALTQFRTALAARDLNGANAAYNAAVSLAPPNDPTVAQAGLDLQKAQGVAGSRDQRTRDFQARLADGNNAMLARRYDDAITAFTAAQVLNPNDPTVPGLLQQAQTARANLQAALTQFRTALAARDLNGANAAYNAAVSLAPPNDPTVAQAGLDLQKAQGVAGSRDQRTRDFQARLTDGNNAMLARRYDDAITAFTAAQVLNPNDPTVPGLLQQAQTARANLQAALTQFRTALAARDLNGANTAYNAAVSLAPPNDPTVAQAGLDLQKAQNTAAAGNANFQAQVTAGKNALQAQRYKDAVTAFTAAQQLNPNDPTVPTLLQQAQNSLNNLQTALSQFRTALAAGNLPGATTAYNTAAGLAPNDPAVVQAGSDLQKAQTTAAAGSANFQAQVTAGKNAMQAQRYQDAVTAFTAAQQLNPNDPTVPTLLQQAQNSLNNLQTALSQFRTALAAGKLTDATTAYNTAKGLAPNDPAVVKAGSDLQKAQSTATAGSANFQAQVTAGKNALQAQRYKDAVTAFTAAQKLNPNDPTVPTLLQQAQTSLNNLQTALSQFRTALAAGKLTDATTAYNTATGLAPNDPAVVQAGSDLQKAQSTAAAGSANFQAQVTAGKNALQAQRYKDAVTAFTAAQKLNPNDPTVATAPPASAELA